MKNSAIETISVKTKSGGPSPPSASDVLTEWLNFAKIKYQTVNIASHPNKCDIQADLSMVPLSCSAISPSSITIAVREAIETITKRESIPSTNAIATCINVAERLYSIILNIFVPSIITSSTYL